MRLYLVQHGEAVEASVDPERPLSPAGLRDAQALAEACRRFGLEAAEVLHSGKPRARQTAEAVADALGLPVRRVAGLDPLDPVAPFAREHAEGGRSVVVVGHLPFLERLASLLLAGREEPAAIAFQRGGMAALERRAPGGWCLLWTAFPRQPCPAADARPSTGG